MTFYKRIIPLPEQELYLLVGDGPNHEEKVFVCDAKTQKIIAEEINRVTRQRIETSRDIDTISYYFMTTGVVVCITTYVYYDRLRDRKRRKTNKEMYFIKYDTEE